MRPTPKAVLRGNEHQRSIHMALVEAASGGQHRSLEHSLTAKGGLSRSQARAAISKLRAHQPQHVTMSEDEGIALSLMQLNATLRADTRTDGQG